MLKRPHYESLDSGRNSHTSSEIGFRSSSSSSSSCCPLLCPQLLRRFFSRALAAEIRLLLKIGWPIIVTNFLNFLILSVSVMMCGHLTKVELDAAALANSLINALGLSVGIGLCAACDTLFSQSYGSANRRRVGTFLLQSLIIISLFPCILWAIHINVLPILLALGQLPEVSRMAADYMLYFSPGLLFNFMYLVLARYLQNQDRVFAPMLCAVAGNLFNVVAQYLCIYVWQLGFISSAVCQALTFVVICVLLLSYIVCSGAYKATWNGWDVECLFNWWQFLRLALPGMGMVSLETFCWEVGTFVAGYMGENELGAQSALFQAETWTFQIALGLSIAVNIRVGQSLGAMNGAAAKLVWQAGVCCLICSAAVTATIFATCKDLLPYIFTNDAAIAAIASRVYPILGLFQLIDGISCVSAGALRGCGRQALGTVLVFTAYYVLGLPIGIPVALLTDLKIFGLWLGLLIGICVSAPAYVILLSRQDWQRQAEMAQDRIQSAEVKQREYDTEAELESAAAAAGADRGSAGGWLPSEVTGLLSDNSSKGSGLSSMSRHRRIPSNPAFTSSTRIVPIRAKPHTNSHQIRNILINRAVIVAAVLCVLLLGVGVRVVTEMSGFYDRGNATLPLHV